MWTKLRHLFEHDDGSLPDIYISNISESEMKLIYAYILSISKVPVGPTLWSLTENRDIKISDISDPLQYFLDDKCSPFRHGLDNLNIENVFLPYLTISVDGKDEISFDYRMGKEWSELEFNALIQMLCKIKNISLKSRIYHADEGGYNDRCNGEFESELKNLFRNKQVYQNTESNRI